MVKTEVRKSCSTLMLVKSTEECYIGGDSVVLLTWIKGLTVLKHYFGLLLSGCLRQVLLYYQVITHVQTAFEHHDLKMDISSFDNVFKKLCTNVFLQE